MAPNVQGPGGSPPGKPHFPPAPGNDPSGGPPGNGGSAPNIVPTRSIASGVIGASAGADAAAHGLIEGQILAFRALATIASAIAQWVERNPADRSLVILTASDEESCAAFRAMNAATEALIGAYDRIAPRLAWQPEAAAREGPMKEAPLPTGINDVLQLIKSTVEIFARTIDWKGNDIPADDRALVAEIAGRIAAKNRAVFVPSFTTRQRSTDTSFLALSEAHARAVVRLSEVKEPALSREKEHFDTLVVADQTLRQQAFAPDHAALLVRGAMVAAMIEDALQMTVHVHAFGTTTKTIRVLSWNWMRVSGGAVASFLVRDEHGRVLMADTRWAHESFTKFADAGPMSLTSPDDPLVTPT